MLGIVFVFWLCFARIMTFLHYNQKRSIEFRVSITILMVLFSIVVLGYMLVRVQYKAAERNYLESRSDINY